MGDNRRDRGAGEDSSPEEVERREVRGGDVSDEEWERQLRQVHPGYVRARRWNRSRLLGLVVLALLVVGVMLSQGRNPLLAAGILVGVVAFVGLSVWHLQRRDEL